MKHHARFLATLLLLTLLADAGASQKAQQPSGPPVSPFLEAKFVARPARGSAPLEVAFLDRSVGNITSWTWDFGDGSGSRQTSPSHTYQQGGLYTVRLTVRLRDGRTDTLEKPDGVIVSSCPASSVRTNRSSPLELGEDFIPITGDDGLGFYVVYSGKAESTSNHATANNVGLFLFPLAGDEVLLFGSGYGDANALVEPTGSAAWDVQRIDALIRFCLGGAPGRTRVRFVAPHGHIDHINADCIRELRQRGYQIPEITFHAGDAGAVQSLPGWTARDQAAFRILQGSTGECREELASYASPLGKLWLYSRPGHTPGSIDLAIDVGGDSTNRVLVLGSAAAFGTCPIPNTREAIAPHGNVQLKAIPPALDSASPAHASARGGTMVSLFGSGFASPGAGPVQVLVDGLAATQVTVLDDGALTCRMPAGLPESTAEVQVLTRNGAAALAGGLTYRPAPTLLSITPDHGPTGGGTPLTLFGSGFQNFGPGPSAVRIGGQAATALSVLDDHTIQCVSPTGAAGWADVEIENGNGSALLAQAFRLVPEVELTDVQPAGGSSLGGTRVVVQGRNFALGSDLPRLFFGAQEALAVVRTSDLRLECTTPPGVAGALVDVRVSAENGTRALTGAFRYFATPALTEVQPASGPARGGDTLTVRGFNFTRNSAGPASVTFDGIAATEVSVLSDGVLRCTVPAGVPGMSAIVEVANANGVGRLEAGYRYHRAPLLTGLDPMRGTHQGGTLVTLQAGGLLEEGAGAPLVTFDGAPATAVELLGDSLLRCRTPAGSASTSVDVRLANGNGEAALPGAYQYVVAPLVGALTPAVGAARGGTLLTLTGSGFLASGSGLPALRLGLSRVTTVRVLDDEHLTFESPPGPPGRAVDLFLENAFGQDSLVRGFRYHELPDVSRVVPPRGPTAGGTEITVVGSGFLAPGAGLPRVLIGAVAASAVVVQDDRTLLCSTPPSAGGAFDVQVRTAWGDALLVNGFAFGSVGPRIDALVPSSGSQLGGVAVTLTGSGFASSTSATRVFFGGAEASAVTVLNDRQLTCLTPSGTPGAEVDVEVRSAGGSALLAEGWRYASQPTLASVSPNHGSALGGLTVNVRGSGFLSDGAGPNQVLFGTLEALDVTVLDDTRLSCRTPASVPGTTVDLVLQNANGRAALSAAFRHHAAPTLTGLDPAVGIRTGGTLVTLTGSGFALATPPDVRFGGRPANAITVIDDATLTCLTPTSSAAGLVSVTLETGDGLALSVDAFRYFAAPALLALAPASGPAAGGTSVLLTGSGFQSDVVGPNLVTFAGVPATEVNTLDDGRVQVLTPPGLADRAVRVELVNANGSTVLDGYRYHALPEVLALDPPGSSALGSGTLSVHGKGFLDQAAGTNSVRFGSVSAEDVTVIDDATLTCRIPPGTPGATVVLGVANANGGSAGGVPFRYFGTPRLTGVTPPHGFSGGVTLVELTGSGFLLDAPGLPEVQFGTRLATDVTVLDDTRLACRAPSGSSGSVTVRVRTANGIGALADGFTYDWAPTLLGLAPASGSALGGTVVELDGAGFDVPEAGPLAVHFGVNVASDVQVLAGDRLRCSAPPGPAGATVTLTVSNAHGSSNLAGSWNYHPRPSLTSLAPPQGPAAGGTIVTLRGAGFSNHAAGPASVSFGGAPATNVVVVDDSTLTCRSPSGSARTSATIVLGNANGSTTLADGFRWTSRSPGDLDDDGLADLVVGASDAVHVFFSGAPLGFRASSDAGLRLVAGSSDFGACTATADLDDDGFIDLVVGAPRDSTAVDEAGAVYVFFGPLSPASLPLTPADAGTALFGQAFQDHFGSALAVGDLNGDGRADLAVGAPGNDAAGNNAGAVHVFLGQAGFPSRSATLADARYLAASSSDAFGTTLGTGDVDADGIVDLVVGAPFHKGAGTNSGALYVFPGAQPLIGRSALLAAAEVSGERSGDQFASALVVGDLDGDGDDDIVAGAPEASRSASAAGGAYVLLGGPGFSSRNAAAAAAVYDGEDGGDRLGSALALGDLNGDGVLDLLIGAPQHDVPNGNSGRAYSVLGGALLGGPILLRAQTVFTSENSSGDLFGLAVSASDLGGDGRAEALVAAPFNNGLGPDGGRVYLFAGQALGATRAAQGADGMLTGAASGMLLGRSLDRGW